MDLIECGECGVYLEEVFIPKDTIFHYFGHPGTGGKAYAAHTSSCSEQYAILKKHGKVLSRAGTTEIFWWGPARKAPNMLERYEGDNQVLLSEEWGKDNRQSLLMNVYRVPEWTVGEVIYGASSEADPNMEIIRGKRDGGVVNRVLLREWSRPWLVGDVKTLEVLGQVRLKRYNRSTLRGYSSWRTVSVEGLNLSLDSLLPGRTRVGGKV